MKKIILLGASGSIGTQTIDIIKEHPDELELVGASVGKNIEFLKKLLEEFSLRYVYSINQCEELEEAYPHPIFYYGDKASEELVKVQDYDLLVNGLVGFVGFKPTLAAIKNHKDVALANKETLVAGGKLIFDAVKENNVHLYPIDSEHSAIWQCLNGHRKEDIKRLIITGSGGAFRDLKRDELQDVSLEKALNHPVWSMGPKITIDSATMMNKGFEIMEAHYLFDLPYDKIDVILHKQSTIHSMVEYQDGSIIAQLGCPDMHLPIKYALLYPKHEADKKTSYLDLNKLSTLDFKKMDYKRYPLVKLAKQVGKFGGNFGAILIGANDEAVDLFLNNRIKFTEIEDYVFNTLSVAHFIAEPTADELVDSHKWARAYVADAWANS